MTEIIMGKGGERFKPHYNHTTERRYHTKADYLADLKAKGLEPYRGEISRKAPKKYEASPQAREMVESLRKGHKPGDRYFDALKKMGVRKVPDSLRNEPKGGWSNNF